MDIKVVFGIGLGLTVAALLFIGWPPGKMDNYQIEQKARELGMVYKNEIIILREDYVEEIEDEQTEDDSLPESED